MYVDHHVREHGPHARTATVWCTAAVGVAVGVNMLVIALVATLALYMLLSMERWKWHLRWKDRITKRNSAN